MENAKANEELKVNLQSLENANKDDKQKYDSELDGLKLELENVKKEKTDLEESVSLLQTEK